MDEIDHGLGVDGGGGVLDLVEADDSRDLGRAIHRTVDGRPDNAGSGRITDDLEDLRGLGCGGGDVGDGRR